MTGRPLFTLDHDRLRILYAPGDGTPPPEGWGELTPVAFEDDADTIGARLQELIDHGVISIINPDRRHALILVYPLSISEPEPVLCVNPGTGGPSVLGGALPWPSDDDGLSGVDWAVEFVAAIVAEANQLAREAERPALSMQAQAVIAGVLISEDAARDAEPPTESEEGESLVVARAEVWDEVYAAYPPMIWENAARDPEGGIA